MPQKYLILKGCAGLGNRIFSILNAISYCKKTGRKLIIDWSDGQFGKKHNNIFQNFFFIDDDVFSDISLKENISFPAEVYTLLAQLVRANFLEALSMWNHSFRYARIF